MPQFHFSDHHQSGAKTELKEGVGGWGLLKDSDIQIRSDTLNPELFVVGNKQKREEKKTPGTEQDTRIPHVLCPGPSRPPSPNGETFLLSFGEMMALQKRGR